MQTRWITKSFSAASFLCFFYDLSKQSAQGQYALHENTTYHPKGPFKPSKDKKRVTTGQYEDWSN